jgi:hypothetical protein
MGFVTLRNRKQKDGILTGNTDIQRMLFFLIGWIVVTGGVPAETHAIDPATSDALKVQHLLKTIAAQKKEPGKNATRKTAVTEKELNAYIAYRLAREKDPVIRNLTVSLLDNNRVRGNIRFDVSGFNLLALLGSDLAFDFDGTLHTRDGGGRIELTSLYLNGQAVPPQTLDAVLVAVAQYYAEAPGSVNDWYELPQGIDRIAVSQARAVLYY